MPFFTATSGCGNQKCLRPTWIHGTAADELGINSWFVWMSGTLLQLVIWQICLVLICASSSGWEHCMSSSVRDCAQQQQQQLTLDWWETDFSLRPKFGKFCWIKSIFHQSFHCLCIRVEEGNELRMSYIYAVKTVVLCSLSDKVYLTCAVYKQPMMEVWFTTYVLKYCASGMLLRCAFS